MTYVRRTIAAPGAECHYNHYRVWAQRTQVRSILCYIYKKLTIDDGTVGAAGSANGRQGDGDGDGRPVEALMGAIGGRWKPVILYHLMGGTRRFSEFRRLASAVSQRMLTQHLRELERNGLVHREVYREAPPRVEYSLSARGRTMKPLLRQMNEWAAAHLVEASRGEGEGESHAAAVTRSSLGA